MMLVSFAKTTKQYKELIKTCTRRDWAAREVKKWQKAYDEGRIIHEAYDKSPRNGGQRIGYFRITQRPYMEKLADMPAADLAAEGGMCGTLAEFYALIGLPPEKEVCVLRFQPLQDAKLCPIQSDHLLFLGFKRCDWGTYRMDGNHQGKGRSTAIEVTLLKNASPVVYAVSNGVPCRVKYAVNMRDVSLLMRLVLGFNTPQDVGSLYYGVGYG